MNPEIMLPANLQAGPAHNVLITVTPVPEDEELNQSDHASLYALELQAYQAVKAKDLAGFKQILDDGMDSTHVFTAIPFDEVLNDTLLQFVVKENFVTAVELLIFHHKRKNLSAAVMTSFMFAMRNNLTAIVRLFLKGIIHNRIYMRLADAFRHAMYKSQYDLVAEIIQKPGFDVNLQATWGLDRPLHIVIQQPEIVLLLLTHGAIVNCSDRKGATPLINACTYSVVESVFLLLQHGANASHTSCQELYPYYSALHATYNFSTKDDCARQIIDLLLGAGLDLRQECRWLHSANCPSHVPEETHTLLQHLSQQCACLRTLCFLAIKSTLRQHCKGSSILNDISKLPLPHEMKRNLTMENLNPVDQSG